MASPEAVKKRIAGVTASGDAIDGDTGELIPGVKVIQREPVFRVELAKEGAKA